jgi:hypothetical protein
LVEVKDGDGQDWAGWWPQISWVQPTPNPNAFAGDAEQQARGRMTETTSIFLEGKIHRYDS